METCSSNTGELNVGLVGGAEVFSEPADKNKPLMVTLEPQEVTLIRIYR